MNLLGSLLGGLDMSKKECAVSITIGTLNVAEYMTVYGSDPQPPSEPPVDETDAAPAETPEDGNVPE